MVILPENRILLGSTNTKDLASRLIREGVADGPVLAMYNLDQVPVPSLKSTRRKPPPAALFALECVHGAVLTDIFLFFRTNAHSYSSELAVPFFGSPADDIVSLQYFALLNSRISHHTLFFPISTLLKHVATTNDRQPKTRHIRWDDWGAAKTSCPYPAINHQNLLSGTRCLEPPRAHKRINIWDLGRACLMQRRPSDSESVPFVREGVELPTEISGWVDAAIAEDVIVIYEASVIIAYLSIFIQPIYTFRVIFRPLDTSPGFIFWFSRLSLPAQKQYRVDVCRLVDKPCCHRRRVTADASDKAKISIIIPKLYSRMSRLVYFFHFVDLGPSPRRRQGNVTLWGCMMDAAGTFAVSRKRRRPSPASSLIGQLGLTAVPLSPLS